jgi:hypothetical protein
MFGLDDILAFTIGAGVMYYLNKDDDDAEDDE